MLPASFPLICGLCTLAGQNTATRVACLAKFQDRSDRKWPRFVDSTNCCPEDTFTDIPVHRPVPTSALSIHFALVHPHAPLRDVHNRYLCTRPAPPNDNYNQLMPSVDHVNNATTASQSSISIIAEMSGEDRSAETAEPMMPAGAEPVIDGSAMAAPGSSGASRADAEEEEAEHINPLGLYLVQKSGRGRGVFAPRAIPAGTHIEDSPVLVLTKQQWEEGKMNDTILGEYGFCWTAGGMALGLGLASLFNHSPTPNVNFIRQAATSTIRFMTARRVEAGEELCICYTADESKLWFVPTAKTSEEANATQAESSESSKSASNANEDASDAASAFPSFTAFDSFFGNDGEAGDDRTEARQRRLDSNTAGEQDLRRDKNARRARYLAKQKSRREAAASADGSALAADVGGLEIQQPSPVPLASSSRSALLAPPGGNTVGEGSSRSVSPQDTLSFPEYPALPEDFSADLPPPLHSDVPARSKPDGDAVVVAGLEWREEDWTGGDKDVDGWADLVKVKGQADKDEEDEEKAMLEVWLVDVVDPRMTRVLLEAKCSDDPRMRHLKRVAKRTHSGERDHTLIVLTCTDDRDHAAICAELSEFDPSLAVLEPFTYLVPATPARTPAGLKTRAAIWPTSYTPFPPQQVSSTTWSPARKAWIVAGVRRVIADALAAKQRGELPVSVFCASPPESLWPQTDSFIPPTPDLRAAASDTRVSAAHPLRHAAFNCIAAVATLRTQPPYSEMTPTRNGADYLLTSLSLFITHEPCVMCCMALLHSRVREVFYLYPRKRGGGLESAFGVHGRKDLNHRYDVWKYDGPLAREAEELLRVDDDQAL